MKRRTLLQSLLGIPAAPVAMAAIAKAKPQTAIHLAPGAYRLTEPLPLTIPPGCALVGGPKVYINGVAHKMTACHISIDREGLRKQFSNFEELAPCRLGERSISIGFRATKIDRELLSHLADVAQR
jgi:hypothetical protein